MATRKKLAAATTKTAKRNLKKTAKEPVAMQRRAKTPAEYSICGIPLVEVPRRKFLCGKTPVTRAQWARVMEMPAPLAEDADLPVDQVSAADCWRFVEKLNACPEATQLGVTFAIPDVDDWKFACRGGNKVDASILGRGWFEQNSDGKLHPVARKIANGYGLYDFAGNVSELCADGKGHGGNYLTDPVHCGPGENGVSLWEECRHHGCGLRVFGYRDLEENWWGLIGRDLWLLILRELPTVKDKCKNYLWDCFDNRDWVELLVAQPSLADRCTRWGEFCGADWASIIESQPQFAAKCDKWADMDAWEWRNLLIKQPQFAERCTRWGEFSGNDWVWILKCQPRFADRCDWSLLSKSNWERLLEKQPSLASKRGCARKTKCARNSTCCRNDGGDDSATSFFG